VGNGYSENHVMEHRLMEYKLLFGAPFEYPEKVKNSFLY